MKTEGRAGCEDPLDVQGLGCTPLEKECFQIMKPPKKIIISNLKNNMEAI